MSKNHKEPYKALGARLKYLREQWQQSTSEVSYTLEIEEKTLKAIEAGKTIPSENLLEMFINHFLLTDEQADDLRDLADQHKEQMSEELVSGIEDMLMKQIIMHIPADNRTFYTDSMHATVNKNGVTLQFMQSGAGEDARPITVSRVGMSKEHAERMVKVLQETLKQHNHAHGSNLLPSPKKDKK